MRASRRRFLGAAAGALVGPALARRAAGADVASSQSDPLVVTRFGATGGGRKTETASLQRAIDACGAAGGGTVLVPQGRFVTGALFLRSRVELRLAAGAVLVASPNPDDYPPIKGRDAGIERTVYSSLLTGVDLEQVAVTGEGMIDGQGQRWKPALDLTHKLRHDAKLPRDAENPPDAPLHWPRPRVVNFIRCRRATVEGITIKDGPAINVQLVYCQDARVAGVTVFQSSYIEGSDGIIVDSSQRVYVTRCKLSTGADCIGIKSGYNEDGRRVGLPCEGIIITNCEMVQTAGSGVVIGSETAGSVRDVLISNCLIHDCLSGIRIRAPRGRGGVVERVRVSKLVVDQAKEMAVKISHFFDSVFVEGWFTKNGPARHNVEIARSVKQPVDVGTPTFRDFVFSGLTLGKVRELAVIEGLPERPISGLVFEDIAVAEASGGINASLAEDVRIADITVATLEAPAVDLRECAWLEIAGIRCGNPWPDGPLVWMENVSHAFVHGCHVGYVGPNFAWARQEQSRAVFLADNAVGERR